MTDKEKIRKEVARLYRESYDNAPTVLHQLMDFINSLPEEPVSEDLEDAAKYYIPDESYHMIIESKEEGSGENVYDCIQMIDMFKAGAKWKEQWMMKDAIEYTILDQNELSTEVATFPPNQGLGKIKEGDNVKIIIVKEN